MASRSNTKAAESASSFVPATHSLARLRAAAADCQGCELFRHATQTVFGDGPAHARLMLVGETPGDQEDRAGHPFVGPAGELLDAALVEAGVDRVECYVTNVVKHFKWTPRGKRRLHSKPSSREIFACRPWLEAEMAAIAPELIVCSARPPPRHCSVATSASRTVAGRSCPVTAQEWCSRRITPRPYCGLRATTIVTGCAELISDLQVAVKWLASSHRKRKAPQSARERTAKSTA